LTRDNKHIEDLIAKYLAGEISPGEEVKLREWLNSSPVNEKYFKDLQYLHDKTITSYTYQRVNTKKAWENVQKKMDNPSKTLPAFESGKKPFMNTWMKAAALIIVLTGLSIIFYNHFTKRTGIIQTNTIASTDSVVNQTINKNAKVVLNRHSKIILTSTKRKLQIQLTGEAFFNVDHSANLPLSIKAEGTLIEDIGTSFNVKALHGANSVEVFVETGEVRFFTSENEGIKVQAGETGQYQKNSGTFSVTKALNPNVIAYKTKCFVFRNARLADVISELSDVYSKHIELGNPKLAGCTISVSFNNEDIGYIMDIIAETLNLKLGRTDSGFILQGEQCNN